MLRGRVAQASAAVGPGSREVPLRPRFPPLTQRSKLGRELGEEDSERGWRSRGGRSGGRRGPERVTRALPLGTEDVLNGARRGGGQAGSGGGRLALRALFLCVFLGSADTAGSRPCLPPGAWPAAAPSRVPLVERCWPEVRRPRGREASGQRSPEPAEPRAEPARARSSAPHPRRARPGCPEPR